ncbi:DUF6328 family protein [Paraconexibacter sp.]|uniref:DUF6328 family protein n=1 Tax=Paraconexibacter sp. TaxID=2949640 RepID=UPI003562F824
MDTAPGDTAPDETVHERDTRRLGELLEETRVAMPGVQVLFGFLLAVPFQQRFTSLSDLERGMYIVALLSAAAATALFITPTAVHRLRFRHRDKAFTVRIGNRLLIGALSMLLLSMNSAVFVVASLVLDGPAPWVLTAASAGLFVALWFGVALLRRETVGGGGGPGGGGDPPGRRP